MLALAAMLMIRSLIELQRIELGFEPRGVLTAQVQLPATAYPRPEDVVRGFRTISERLSQMPGVIAEHIRSAPRGMTLVVTAAGDPAALAPALRDAVRSVDPNLPVSDVRPMSDVTAQALAEPRFVTSLLVVFAAAALLVAAVGVYGTVSLLVSERTREIGLRLALGAGPASVLALVLSEGARLTATGLGLGVLVAAALARLLSGLVYGVSLFDPLTVSVVPLALGAVALTASLVPARRAAATSPAVILK